MDEDFDCNTVESEVWAYFLFYFFFFKQKTAYEIVDCDWSSDVCSSDLKLTGPVRVPPLTLIGCSKGALMFKKVIYGSLDTPYPLPDARASVAVWPVSPL